MRQVCAFLSDGSLSDTALGSVDHLDRPQRGIRFDTRSTQGPGGLKGGLGNKIGSQGQGGPGSDPAGMGRKSNSTSQLSATGKHQIVSGVIRRGNRSL